MNEALAKELIEVVKRAMASAESLDLGRTRHAKLPSFIPQTYKSPTVDPAQVEQFDIVLHLLTCAIFGVDSDGDRAVQHATVDRTRYETLLPSLQVPRTNMDSDEATLWAQLTAAKLNLQRHQTAFDQAFRGLEWERMHGKGKRK